MSKTVTLHCEIGNHPWERPSGRGRRPRNCPDHTPQEPSVSKDSPNPLQEGRERKAASNRCKTIEEIVNHPRASRCYCGITPDMTDDHLKKMVGCTSPYFVCGTLDSVRRTLGI